MVKLSLKAARVNADLTQKNVSKKIGISESTLIKWESGKIAPRVDQLQLLCELYDITIDDIFLGKRFA